MIPASPLTRPSARAVTAVPRTDGNSRVIRPVLGCQVYRARSGRLKGTLRRSVRDVLRKTGRGTSDLKKHHSGSRRGKGDNLALKKIGLDFGGHYRQAQVIDGVKKQEIKIIYNFIGNIQE